MPYELVRLCSFSFKPMALTATITLTDNFKEQITFNNAYVRVECIQATRHWANAEVLIFKATNGDLLERKNYEFMAELEQGQNHIKQAYEHLKTLPEFSDAVDC
jgi:hypothetical protein